MEISEVQFAKILLGSAVENCYKYYRKVCVNFRQKHQGIEHKLIAILKFYEGLVSLNT